MAGNPTHHEYDTLQFHEQCQVIVGSNYLCESSKRTLRLYLVVCLVPFQVSTCRTRWNMSMRSSPQFQVLQGDVGFLSTVAQNVSLLTLILWQKAVYSRETVFGGNSAQQIMYSVALTYLVERLHVSFIHEKCDFPNNTVIEMKHTFSKLIKIINQSS